MDRLTLAVVSLVACLAACSGTDAGAMSAPGADGGVGQIPPLGGDQTASARACAQDSDCDDHDPCTVGTCVLATQGEVQQAGYCAYAPAPDASACASARAGGSAGGGGGNDGGAAIATGGSAGPPGCVCVPGATRWCDAVCLWGIQTCMPDGMGWGKCVEQATPRPPGASGPYRPAQCISLNLCCADDRTGSGDAGTSGNCPGALCK
jgi:hypothetical protein